MYVSKAPAAAAGNSNIIESDFRFPHKGRAEFDLRGENSTFGRYSCFGEVVDMKTGDSLGVLTDKDGDQIVGVVTLTPQPEQTVDFHISWRDSVQFSNGRRFINTGKFAGQRPPGLVVVDTSSFLARVLAELRRRL